MLPSSSSSKRSKYGGSGKSREKGRAKMHGTAGVGAVSLSVAALVAANKHTTGTASSLPIEVKASAEAGGGVNRGR